MSTTAGSSESILAGKDCDHRGAFWEGTLIPDLRAGNTWSIPPRVAGDPEPTHCGFDTMLQSVGTMTSIVPSPSRSAIVGPASMNRWVSYSQISEPSVPLSARTKPSLDVK